MATGAVTVLPARLLSAGKLRAAKLRRALGRGQCPGAGKYPGPAPGGALGCVAPGMAAGAPLLVAMALGCLSDAAAQV